MSEYYGVQRSEEYLAHYGILGMKWGVRKARQQGNSVPKSFGYRRAERKLAKLEAKANRNTLLAKANRLDKVSKGARRRDRRKLERRAFRNACGLRKRKGRVRRYNENRP